MDPETTDALPKKPEVTCPDCKVAGADCKVPEARWLAPIWPEAMLPDNTEPEAIICAITPPEAIPIVKLPDG